METTTVKYEAPKLKAIVNNSPTGQEVMLHLAARDRNARNGILNVTSIHHKLLEEGKKVIDEDFDKFWKVLEENGIGQFIVGRSGNPDRFKCHYAIRDLATAAVEGKDADLRPVFAVASAKAPAKRRSKRGPGRPKGYSPKKAAKKQGRQRLSSEAKQIEREVMQKVRQALAQL